MFSIMSTIPTNKLVIISTKLKRRFHLQVTQPPISPLIISTVLDLSLVYI